MSYADFEAPVGGGCTVLRMTRDRLDVPDLTDRLGADVTPISQPATTRVLG